MSQFSEAVEWFKLEPLTDSQRFIRARPDLVELLMRTEQHDSSDPSAKKVESSDLLPAQ